MHFGRVSQLDRSQLTLPNDSIRTERLLNLPRNEKTKLYLGCPIWASPKWVGILYPKKTKPSEFLHVYASQFNTVELNSSFYHLMEKPRIVEWANQVPSTFRFCPKVFRGITENLCSVNTPHLIKNYCEAISSFEEKLGLCFAQFSESFSPRNWDALKFFLAQWPTQIPLAVELRHPDWFVNHTLKDEVVNTFYRSKIATVITDTPGRRDVLHLSLSQAKALIRFQGNEGDSSDENRLEEWTTRLKKWQKHSLEEIYFFTHQPSDGLIPKTAQYLQRGFEADLRIYWEENKIIPETLF